MLNFCVVHKNRRKKKKKKERKKCISYHPQQHNATIRSAIRRTPKTEKMIINAVRVPFEDEEVLPSKIITDGAIVIIL